MAFASKSTTQLTEDARKIYDEIQKIKAKRRQLNQAGFPQTGRDIEGCNADIKRLCQKVRPLLIELWHNKGQHGRRCRNPLVFKMSIEVSFQLEDRCWEERCNDLISSSNPDDAQLRKIAFESKAHYFFKLHPQTSDSRRQAYEAYRAYFKAGYPFEHLSQASQNQVRTLDAWLPGLRPRSAFAGGAAAPREAPPPQRVIPPLPKPPEPMVFASESRDVRRPSAPMPALVASPSVIVPRAPAVVRSRSPEEGLEEGEVPVNSAAKRQREQDKPASAVSTAASVPASVPAPAPAPAPVVVTPSIARSVSAAAPVPTPIATVVVLSASAPIKPPQQAPTIVPPAEGAPSVPTPVVRNRSITWKTALAKVEAKPAAERNSATYFGIWTKIKNGSQKYDDQRKRGMTPAEQKENSKYRLIKAYVCWQKGNKKMSRPLQKMLKEVKVPLDIVQLIAEFKLSATPDQLQILYGQTPAAKGIVSVSGDQAGAAAGGRGEAPPAKKYRLSSDSESSSDSDSEEALDTDLENPDIANAPAETPAFSCSAPKPPVIPEAEAPAEQASGSLPAHAAAPAPSDAPIAPLPVPEADAVASPLPPAPAPTRIVKLQEDEQEFDVPGDGTCLYYSVALSLLLPVVHDDIRFRAAYIKLFGEKDSEAVEQLQKCLRTYNGTPKFISKQSALLETLINTDFRARVLEYLQKNQATLLADYNSAQTEAEQWTEADFLDYIARQSIGKSWGGNFEILAMHTLLNIRIQVYRTATGGYVANDFASEGEGDPIKVVFVNMGGESENENHYHFIGKKHFVALVPPVLGIDTHLGAGGGGPVSSKEGGGSLKPSMKTSKSPEELDRRIARYEAQRDMKQRLLESEKDAEKKKTILEAIVTLDDKINEAQDERDACDTVTQGGLSHAASIPEVHHTIDAISSKMQPPVRTGSLKSGVERGTEKIPIAVAVGTSTSSPHPPTGIPSPSSILSEIENLITEDDLDYAKICESDRVAKAIDHHFRVARDLEDNGGKKQEEGPCYQCLNLANQIAQELEVKFQNIFGEELTTPASINQMRREDKTSKKTTFLWNYLCIQMSLSKSFSEYEKRIKSSSTDSIKFKEKAVDLYEKYERIRLPTPSQKIHYEAFLRRQPPTSTRPTGPSRDAGPFGSASGIGLSFPGFSGPVPGDEGESIARSDGGLTGAPGPF